MLQISKAQKALLKEKFKVGSSCCPSVCAYKWCPHVQGFNTELEELCRVHGQYSVPDARLRQRVREDSCQLLGAMYSEFFRVYVCAIRGHVF